MQWQFKGGAYIIKLDLHLHTRTQLLQSGMNIVVLD